MLGAKVLIFFLYFHGEQFVKFHFHKLKRNISVILNDLLYIDDNAQFTTVPFVMIKNELDINDYNFKN